MGTPESAVPSLARCLADGHEVAAVWTQPDRPAGRGEKIKAPAVKEFALRHNLQLEQPKKIRNELTCDLLDSYKADVVVVVAYGRILPAEFLRAPRCGCVNVHFSLLPKYRGAAPVNWAIANGEQESGVTTMLIEEELDAGPILLQRATEIHEEEAAPLLMVRLATIGAELLSITLAQLNTITPRPQRNEEASFAPLLKRDDGLIDWSMDASAIERRVRGFQPWPSAYTFYSSRRLIVWRAAAESVENNPQPGTVIAAHGDDLLLSCGSRTALRLLEVQTAGALRMTAREFLNGAHIKVGVRWK